MLELQNISDVRLGKSLACALSSEPDEIRA